MVRKGVDVVIWHDQAVWLTMRDERAVGKFFGWFGDLNDSSADDALRDCFVMLENIGKKTHVLCIE